MTSFHAQTRLPWSRTSIALICACLVALLGSLPASADDRRLFLQSADQPYVFTLLDTSGSFHWQAGALDTTATRGDGDSPLSRLYQAKSALYEVVEGLNPGIRLGFAHFNQEDLDIRRKHWIYQRAQGSANPPWFADLPFPAPGVGMFYGRVGFDGDDGILGNCNREFTYSTWGGALLDGVTVLEVVPKGGDLGTNNTWYIVGWNGNRYVVYVKGLNAGDLGQANINMQLQVWRVSDDNCTIADNYGLGTEGPGGSVVNVFNNLATLEAPVTVPLEPRWQADLDGNPITDGNGDPIGNDFVNWHFNTNLGNDPNCAACADVRMNNVCNSIPSWAPNDTPATGYQTPESQLRYATFADPLARDATNQSFHRGEVIPWDWMEHPLSATPSAGFEVSNRQEILYRLAPNISVAGEFITDGNGDPIPDFRVARYLEDNPTSGVIGVKSQFSRYPPIANSGSTPLEGMMNALADWYEDWEPTAEDPTVGDDAFGCRERYVILLTDGEETCGGTPALAAQRLSNLGLRVFVVAFGGGLSAAQVQNIADAGGTGQLDIDSDGTMDCLEFSNENIDLCPGPIQADDRDQLVEALQDIFDAVEARPRSFASAATSPSRTSDGSSLFLSSFLPLQNDAVWRGSVSHYVQPLPTVQDPDSGNLVPNPNVTCDGLDPARSCLAWEAADEILNQALDSIPVTAATTSEFALGVGINERRVLYTMLPTVSPTPISPAPVPYPSRLLGPSTVQEEEFDLWWGLGLSFDVMSSTEIDTTRDRALSVLRETYQIKTADDPRTALQDPNELRYVLGDVFHSTPTLASAPSRPRYQVFNINGYQDFFKLHEFRRKVLIVGANDGQLHFFDAGLYDPTFDSGRLDRNESNYDLGSGREVFSFVPREAVERQFEIFDEPETHEFSVDSTVRVDDVYIDPLHNGTPTADDREWRTVVIGALREGGKSIFAIDITQPDPLTEEVDTFDVPVWIPDRTDYVPDCMRLEPNNSFNQTQCGTIPYGSTLWELTDSEEPDLGFTWSMPITGRIELTDGTDTFERYVAIMGGGLDPDDLTKGHHLYMIDIETGHILYKRNLGGPTPSEPAVLDRSGDGFIDTVYVGTTLGDLYKVDLSTPVEIVNDAVNGELITDVAWEPFQIFDTGGRPIFFPPSVIRFTEGRSIVSFGTGWREDLWDPAADTEEGRFYVLLDNFFDSSMTTLTESDIRRIELTDADLDTSPLEAEGGYYFPLDPSEKLLSRVFTLAGVTVFSTFVPVSEPTVIDGELVCQTRGFSNIYVVFTATGNAVNPSGDRSRIVEGIVSNPFADLHGGGDGDDDTGDPNDPPDPSDLEQMMEALRDFLPDNCRFTNVTVPLKMIRDDTGLESVVDFPVCVRYFNWGDNIR